jgi:NOL1/NOP2/fmu family ribosome biogenesis protein
VFERFEEVGSKDMKFIKSGEKKNIVNELNVQFGIDKLSYVLVETGKQKIRGFSGSMTRDEIVELSEIANVEIVGIYLMKNEKGGMRLGLDGSMILSNKIKKSVIEIKCEEMELWINGKNLEIVKDSGIYVVKFKEDYLGSGISDGKKILNFVPKERRVRRN